MQKRERHPQVVQRQDVGRPGDDLGILYELLVLVGAVEIGEASLAEDAQPRVFEMVVESARRVQLPGPRFTTFVTVLLLPVCETRIYWFASAWVTL